MVIVHNTTPLPAPIQASTLFKTLAIFSADSKFAFSLSHLVMLKNADLNNLTSFSKRDPKKYTHDIILKQQNDIINNFNKQITNLTTALHTVLNDITHAIFQDDVTKALQKIPTL